MTKAVIVVKKNKFKNIVLTCNKKSMFIDKNQFLTSVGNNLKKTL